KWRIDWESNKLSVCEISSETNKDVLIISNEIIRCNILDNNALIIKTRDKRKYLYRYDIDKNKIMEYGMDNTEHENIEIVFNDQKYRWRIDWKNKKLSICKNTNKEYKELCSKDLEYLPYNWNILNNNALALLNEDHLALLDEGRSRITPLYYKHITILTIFKYDIND